MNHSRSTKSLTIPVLCISDAFLFLSRPLILDFLYLLSLDESDFLDDESDNDGSDSGSSGMCAFPFRFGDSVGCVSGVGSGVLFQ